MSFFFAYSLSFIESLGGLLLSSLGAVLALFELSLLVVLELELDGLEGLRTDRWQEPPHGGAETPVGREGSGLD